MREQDEIQFDGFERLTILTEIFELHAAGEFFDLGDGVEYVPYLLVPGSR